MTYQGVAEAGWAPYEFTDAFIDDYFVDISEQCHNCDYYDGQFCWVIGEAEEQDEFGSCLNFEFKKGEY